MSQIPKTSLALALGMLAFVGVLSVAGCGDKASESHYDPDSGRHPADWLPFRHGQVAQQHPDTCTPCHGNDFTGGISKVPCTLCHLNIPPVDAIPPAGPGTAEYQVHGPFGYALHAPYVREHGTSQCSNVNCHGTNLEGAAGPSCINACHMGGPFSFHPPEWRNQIGLHGGYALQNGTAACRNAVCHGPQLKGVFLSGPACTACHGATEPLPALAKPQ